MQHRDLVKWHEERCDMRPSYGTDHTMPGLVILVVIFSARRSNTHLKTYLTLGFPQGLERLENEKPSVKRNGI